MKSTIIASFGPTPTALNGLLDAPTRTLKFNVSGSEPEAAGRRGVASKGGCIVCSIFGLQCRHPR
jgi:hypothetical protein